MKKRLLVQGQLSDAQLATLEHLFEVTQLSKAMSLDAPDNRQKPMALSVLALRLPPNYWMQRPILKSSRLYRWVTTTSLSMN